MPAEPYGHSRTAMPPASATRPALSLATSLMMARYNKLRAAIRTNDNPTLTITPLQLSSLVAPPPALLTTYMYVVLVRTTVLCGGLRA